MKNNKSIKKLSTLLLGSILLAGLLTGCQESNHETTNTESLHDELLKETNSYTDDTKSDINHTTIMPEIVKPVVDEPEIETQEETPANPAENEITRSEWDNELEPTPPVESDVEITDIRKQDFAEKRRVVEDSSKIIIEETGKSWKNLGNKVVETYDNNVDDKTKDDINKVKENAKTIGNGIKDTSNDIIDVVIPEKTQDKFKSVKDIISNKTKETLDEIKNNK